MKKERVFSYIILILIVICVIVGFIVRRSFVDDTNFNDYKGKMDNYSIQYLGTRSYKQYFNCNIKNYNELEKDSTFILKVKLSGSREKLSSTTLSQVTVLDIYKGDSIKKGQKIYIYEPSFIENDMYWCSNGYNLMLNDTEYIVYLNSLKVPDGYNKTEKEKNSYMFTTLEFSKFDINNKNNVNNLYSVKDFDNGKIKYNDLKNDNVVVVNKDILEKYTNIKKEVKKIYYTKNK
ncbi:hypothetical protein [Clostridium botulinum]|uniref:Uncharacterized protein n=1 Tax=Clostridium botulinum TaxID=1491 RepID=A0A9Q1UYN3_CLOBO|nr:hypothetical protein [Clostridium botulinum]AEB76817.1 hypothetical protein CbC4_2152 [Clostridium botulinum BKT015925]KEI02600.1 hypothetical protein Z953_06870 [Clostridium botulinum D str. 16868]KEI02695.1 hypothetical protein Y848_06860 [Clostridium botulinum C/D str. Sp77]KLU74746.1 hypothetical protein CBC3_12560 [Clostridium botulinum V891]KOA76950.1 hypothetical protein ADU78_05160 [Clostridium botulinum]